MRLQTYPAVTRLYLAASIIRDTGLPLDYCSEAIDLQVRLNTLARNVETFYDKSNQSLG